MALVICSTLIAGAPNNARLQRALSRSPDPSAWALVILLSFIVVAFALFSALAWLGNRKKRREELRLHRLAHGQCLRCGYDLRGGQEHCPECGEFSARWPASEAPRSADD